ncbi:thiamine pyrophosphate-dependent enzyme [Reichenbachiella sp. MALMAid0571]|uniref:alpha-ketoacid dehydrogenase subunit alpha/beta n=1 Tax=Reichenbachiella sp. MALMAid0571 TaxID=3143939 RepID=UPI0032DE725E
MQDLTQLSVDSELQTEVILSDYKLAVESRENSYIGRKEVFMGKAKFGIFGDGKEIPQIAMAKVFRNGDFRSGYYRDQTFMMAIGELTSQEFFAQLYAHTDVKAEPASAGRLMNGHFATRSLDENGNWKNLMEMKNSSADISCTAGQIPRLLGLGYASKLYRENPDLHSYKTFSDKGNEVAFGTIGNASTSEGAFLEMINAAGVLQVPMVLAVWDDEYGISVPNKYHTTKSSISKALAGFQRNENEKGIEIFVVKGWDYLGLCETFKKADKIAREEHVPVLVHVIEVTQPQGHSTSGSHERYKSRKRLDWERKYDCVKQMREWILSEGIATDNELDEIEEEAKSTAKNAKNIAWKAYLASVKGEVSEVLKIINKLASKSQYRTQLTQLMTTLRETVSPNKLDVEKAAKKSLRWTRKENFPERQLLIDWINERKLLRHDEYSSHVYSESEQSALKVAPIHPVYAKEFKLVDGREVLNAAFDDIFRRNPLVFTMGEDVGKIGDVNQGMAGLQDKYGELRVTDTGIRETSIMGQGIGAALRGLRPIAEIQYLDYIYYCIQVLTDDLACLHYRTKGGQKAPLIIRTRGHRLEGVWHSGSPMSMILGSLRGIYLLVPRNMTQAAGFYNTMLESDDIAIIIESLNGYRLKEKLPENIGKIRVPLGQPEILKEGKDITVVTYGSMCRIVMEAAKQLADFGIDVEVIDVQTLAPFDLNNEILKSLKKTNRIVFADEDVPGGATAYMMQKVLEEQGGYRYLDSKPLTISSKEHRPAYGSDGDYYSKPNAEEIFEKVYEVMSETDPISFPSLY